MDRTLFSDGKNELDEIGVPHIVAVTLDASGGLAVMMPVPAGYCFLIQRIVGQCLAYVTPGYDFSPVLATPGVLPDFRDGINFKDAAGTTQWEMMWRPFIRGHQLFTAVSPVLWRGSVPDSSINWQLRFPLCVPPGWTLNGVQNTLCDTFVCYGRLVSESAARGLGYTTNPSATDADRMCGVDSLVTFTTTQIIVPARTGHSIQILDIHLRCQPTVAAITNGTMTVEQGDGRPIFVLANNNPGELREVKFAPGLYLKPGQSLNAKSSTALIGNVVVSWRYVPTADVPSDHWWACVEPGLPTPLTTQVGSGDIGRAESHQVTCYYPRLDTTKTSPTQGYQHLLRGYMVSIQKDPIALPNDAGSDTSDLFMAQISTGSSAGRIGFATLHSVANSGVPLTPVFAGLAHDQCFAVAVDRINLPGLKDNGSLWINTLAFGPLTLATPQTTVNVDEFWVSLWGKTIPSLFSDPSNRGGIA